MVAVRAAIGGILILVASACGGQGTTPSPARATSQPSIAASPSGPAASASASEPSVRVVSDVVFHVDADGRRHVVTIYAPTTGDGPWPVAVMLHGGGGYPLVPHGSLVAARGAVVFAPQWSEARFPWPNAAAYRADLATGVGQLACAVRFARSEASRYGGDGSILVLYGHSAGASLASLVAFASPSVPSGCAVDAGSVAPGRLVLFDGDWLLAGDPVWDVLLREDPGVFDVGTPWSYLEAATRIPVHVIDSGDPSLSASFDEEFLELRDPTGEFRRGLETAGALDDGRLSETEFDQLFHDRLTALGYDATFVPLPDSMHTYLSEAAYPIVLDAIVGSPG